MDKSKPYPFNVRITNYYAPVETLKDGQVRIGKCVGSYKIGNISLSDSEWISIVETMHDRLRDFDIYSAPAQIKKAEDAYANNLEKSKE